MELSSHYIIKFITNDNYYDEKWNTIDVISRKNIDFFKFRGLTFKFLYKENKIKTNINNKYINFIINDNPTTYICDYNNKDIYEILYLLDKIKDIKSSEIIVQQPKSLVWLKIQIQLITEKMLPSYLQYQRILELLEKEK